MWLAFAPVRAQERVVDVHTRDELRAAAAAARPGTRIRLAPGTYEGGLHLEGLRGAKGAPIVIEAADVARPPCFQGGTSGLQLSAPEHVELRQLVFSGQTGNGLNIDDGGNPATSAHHLELVNLVVRDVGPDGNRDGTKLSGVVDFRVAGCTLERWGRGGSGIDLVGCRRGAIERTVFRHGPEAREASGVQAKGGTREVAIRRCRFELAGARAINAGGSTGLAYFRPPLAAWTGDKYEAAALVIEGNTFIGGDAAVAFVGIDGAAFRFNTVYVPNRWWARILQETREPGFVLARRGVIAHNLIAFRSDRWSEGGVNVGSNTEPTSFRFEGNAWTCLDAPARTRALVRLPVSETDGRYGDDPRFRDAEAGDLTLLPDSPLARVAATALPE